MNGLRFAFGLLLFLTQEQKYFDLSHQGKKMMSKAGQNPQTVRMSKYRVGQHSISRICWFNPCQEKIHLQKKKRDQLESCHKLLKEKDRKQSHVQYWHGRDSFLFNILKGYVTIFCAHSCGCKCVCESFLSRTQKEIF